MKKLNVQVLCALAVLFCNCGWPADFDQQGIATLEYPLNGAKLGQGVTLGSGLATAGICIVGQSTNANPGGDAPQVVTVSMRNDTDASTFFSDTGVSADAQVQVLLGSADAKATFISKQSYQRDSTTLSVYATAEQHQYVVPPGALPADSGKGVDLNISSGIKLNNHALRLLKRHRYKEFASECGDGFVAVVVSGAELVGTISTIGYSSMDTSDQSLSGGFKAMGAGVDATMNSEIEEATSGKIFKLSYIESGGSGVKAPTEANDLIAAIQNLPAVAHEAPMPFQVVIRDYQSLPNYPTPGQAGTLNPLDKVMLTYWRLQALLNEAANAENTLASRQVSLSYFWGYNASVGLASIRQLYDQISAQRALLEKQALSCYQTPTSCGAPVVSTVKLYDLAALLPLPNLPPLPAALDEYQASSSLLNLVKSFNAAKRFWYTYASRQPAGGNCYNRDHILTQVLESQGYPKNIETALANYESFESGEPARLRDAAVDFYVRQPAHQHCSASPNDPDCSINEVTIAMIAAEIPLRGPSMTSDFDADQTYRYGQCNGSPDTTRYLHLTFMAPTDSVPLVGKVQH